MSLPSRNNCPDHSPPWAIPPTLKCNLERMYNPRGMFVLHQPPKRMILWNCSQLWTLKEWLPDEADHSTLPLLRVTAKKNVCPRPFLHTGHKRIVVYGTSTIYRTIFITKMTVRSGTFFELENAYPSEISNHFPNWKGTAHPRPFFELKNDYP